LEEDLRYWVALNLVVAESPRSANLIAKSFSPIRNVFESSKRDLFAVGLNKETVNALRSSNLLARADYEIERLDKKGCYVLTKEDKRYPEYLREIFDPPLVLYCAGEAEVLNESAVSVVGARKPTPYGRAVAEKLTEELSSRGLVIVSGLARGIDSIAHWGALKGGKTVAVLGSGLNKIYPRENRRLFEKIVDKGMVLSEYPLDSPPLGYHFPLRNRIISGLSLASVVIEATQKSGSLITARLALEQNREVMAVPGRITSELSRGTNWLIKNGAKLVEDWRDIVEELPLPLRESILSKDRKKRKKLPSLNSEEREIYDKLEVDTLTSVDDLVERCRLSVSEVLSILLSLELKDLIIQRPGKFLPGRRLCGEGLDGAHTRFTQEAVGRGFRSKFQP
jgi:DNA processing protein